MADATTLPPELLAQLASKRLGFTTSADSARQQSDQGYADQLHNLDIFGADQSRSIDDNFSSSGLFNSGIRVDSQGRLQRNIGDRRGQLGSQHSGDLSNIQNMLNQQLQGVEDQQAQYALDYNRTQAQQALADAQAAANASAPDLQAQIDQLAQQQSVPAAPSIDPYTIAALMQHNQPAPRSIGVGGGARSAR